MTDDLNPSLSNPASLDLALEVDVLAASLSLDRQESGDLLSLLALKLKGGLPHNTQVEKGWMGMGAVQSVTLCFDDAHYQISRGQYGSLVAKVIKVVRGVKIKTTEIPAAEWSQQVAAALASAAKQDANMRHALNRFVLG